MAIKKPDNKIMSYDIVLLYLVAVDLFEFAATLRNVDSTKRYWIAFSESQVRVYFKLL
jgi:hypothetical protein